MSRRNTDFFFLKFTVSEYLLYELKKHFTLCVGDVCVCVYEGSHYEYMICWQANVISRRNGNVNLFAWI